MWIKIPKTKDDRALGLFFPSSRFVCAYAMEDGSSVVILDGADPIVRTVPLEDIFALFDKTKAKAAT